MPEVLLFMIPVFMLGVVGALVMGLTMFGQEGRAARERSNRLMQWRIGLQFVAVALILVFFLISAD